MNFLNIVSSHYPGSFAAELAEVFSGEVQNKGHQSQIIDLYGDAFNPTMNGDDFNQFKGGPLPEDVLSYQKQLEANDVYLFYYPVWWNDMPAIMKGFVDRVFAKGFAYDFGPTGKVGMLNGKKAALICTLGNKKSETPTELEDAMRLKERRGVFEYCNIELFDHLFFYREGVPDEHEIALNRVRDLAHRFMEDSLG